MTFFQDLEHSEGFHSTTILTGPHLQIPIPKKKKKSKDFLQRKPCLHTTNSKPVGNTLKVSKFRGRVRGSYLHFFFGEGGKCYIINMYCVLELGLGLGFFKFFFVSLLGTPSIIFVLRFTRGHLGA